MGNKLASTLTYHSTPSLKELIWRFVRTESGDRLLMTNAESIQSLVNLVSQGGFGSIREFERLESLSPENGPVLRLVCQVPTLSGRIMPNSDYPDRWAITEALLPHVRDELIGLVEAGCTEITVDEPSMSCYGYKEDTRRFVDIFNRTVEGVVGKCRLSTHLCFGNYKGHAVSLRRYAPLFPDFLELAVDEIHLEMASREYSELEIIEEVAKTKDVCVEL